jgi:uncharacterized membrane protein YccC
LSRPTSAPLARALHFLAVELAPSPARWRATARTTIACTVAALLIVSLHVPHGHWIIMTILVVHQPNAGGSVRKGVERIIGTIAGSAAAIVAIAAFAQQPWFAFPLIGALCAAGLFISRVSVVPYAALLTSVTVALFMSISVLEPNQVVSQGLWRMLLICVGVVIGTGAHLLLWPVDPERDLLRGLAKALERVAGALRRFGDGVSDPAADRALVTAAVSELPGELALLQAAEARYPSLRRRHVEQLVLIGSVSRLVTAAAGLVEETRPEEVVDERARRGIERIASLCEAHARWIARHDDDLADAGESPRAPDPSGAASSEPAPPPPGSSPAAIAVEAASDQPTSPELARVLARLIEMEKAIAPIPAALAFVGDPRGRRGSLVLRSPLDDPPEPTFLTPAFSLSNTTDLVYAMKGGLAAMAAEAAGMGLAMSSPSTATVTAVIVAQGTVGATFQRAVLRALGAVVGGALALASMVLVFPGITGLGPFLAVATASFAVAAYVCAGGPRTAYTGIQIGMAYAMSILDTFGPATDLSVPLDRVLGILLGIAVFTAIDFAIAPTFAREESTRRIASALVHLAALMQRTLGETGAALRAASRAAIRPLSALRRQTVEDLTAALQREDEALLEPGASAPAEVAARRARLALLHQVQEILLVVLAIARDRLNLDLESIPLERRRTSRELAAAIGPNLEAIADRLRGLAPRPAPPLAPLLAALETDAAAHCDDPLFPLIAQRGFYREIAPMIEELARDADSYAGALSSRSRVSPS